LNSRKCSICGSTDQRPLYPDTSDHITGDPFSIVQCKECKTGFTHPVPENLNRYYPSQYRGYGGLTAAVLRTLYRIRARGWAKLKSSPGSILEIGCGPGLMLETFKSLGWTVQGIERTESVAEYARNELGIPVISDGIEKLPRQPSFDLIVMFNVLEHLPDPNAILDECVARLNPGGFLIINVPNLNSWQARFGGARWVHLDPPRHLIHFTPASLKRLLKNKGLEIDDVSFISWEHDPFGWLQSAINKFTGSYNVLTRYLMGMETMSGQVLVSLAWAGLLAVPSVMLAVVSWTEGNGALMQVCARPQK